MIDNKSKKLAFESLALVSSALKLIEIKNLGVFRFGAETESILQLGDELNDVVGKVYLILDSTFLTKNESEIITRNNLKNLL
jgi:midasin (ATPase involved in ribosome maturation)